MTTSHQGFYQNNEVFLEPRSYLLALGATFGGATGNGVDVKICGRTVAIVFVLHQNKPYVNAIVVAQ
jgi:hypothetical protein